MSETSSLGRFTPFQASASIQDVGDGTLPPEAESEIPDNDDSSFAVKIVDEVDTY